MFFRSVKIFFKFFAFLVLVQGHFVHGAKNFSLSSSTDAKNQIKTTSAWKKEMWAIGTAFSQLYPLALNKDNFKDAKKIATMVENLGQIALHAKNLSLPKVAQSLSDSENLDLHIWQFKADSRLAYQELKKNNIDYAQNLIQNLAQNCIACHTIKPAPMNPQIKFSGQDISHLNEAQKAQYLTATRQFEGALLEYDKYLSNFLKTENRRLELEQALQEALKVALRVQQNPEKGKTLIGKTLQNPYYPEIPKEDLKAWQKILEESFLEKQQNISETNSFKSKNAQSLLSEIEELNSQISKIKKYPADKKATPFYLKITSLAYQTLSMGKLSQAEKAKIFYQLGLAYENTFDEHLSNMHDLYFVKCIDAQPNSRQAQACYQSLKNSLELGFTGNSGLNLPKDISAQLHKLQKLAYNKNKLFKVGQEKKRE